MTVSEFLATISTVLIVFYGIGYSLLGYNDYFRDRMIERMTDAAGKVNMKPESELKGRRVMIRRPARREIRTNIYLPSGKGPYRTIFLSHPSQFIDGDIDLYDDYCDRMKDVWNCAIISINYSKITAHRSTYPQEEIADAVIYYMNMHQDYGIDPRRCILLGFEAGAYLNTIAAINLLQKNIRCCGYIMINPFMDYVIPSFIQAGYRLEPVTCVTSGYGPAVRKVEEYVDLLELHTVDHAYKEYRDAKDGFITDDPDTLDAVQRRYSENCAAWLLEQMERYWQNTGM